MEWQSFHCGNPTRLAVPNRALKLTVVPDTDLRKNIFDLFSAGFDTTSNMTRYVILYMAAHPDVQRKVQRHIDEVVPRGEVPASRHRARWGRGGIGEREREICTRRV